ncbi:MAG: SGNH/GDSL hydrolase family protein, partial [Burkholderiales bacterium]
MKRILSAGVVLVITAAALIVVGELGLRLAGFNAPIWYQPDRELGWTLRPDAHGWFTKEGRAYAEINPAGFRDEPHALAKPRGVYRIAVLGDSVAAGLRVERYEDTFPAILEKMLRENGVRAEVMSFAVSGYNTQQEVETLKDKALRYQPDLVLVAYSLTDRERMDGDILKTLLEEETRKGGSALHAHPLLLHSALYRFLRFRVLAPRQRPEAT